MAINYEPFKWDPTKKFNPSNMNHMDNGIKAACDKADANEKVIDELNSNLKAKIGLFTPANENYMVDPSSYVINQLLINIISLRIAYTGTFPKETYYQVCSCSIFPEKDTILSVAIEGRNVICSAMIYTTGIIKIMASEDITNPVFMISGTYA